MDRPYCQIQRFARIKLGRDGWEKNPQRWGMVTVCKPDRKKSRIDTEKGRWLTTERRGIAANQWLD